jgi:hypothetical protein
LQGKLRILNGRCSLHLTLYLVDFIMLKVRIIAALIAIVLTAITIYLAPFVIAFFQHWHGGLSPQARQLFNWSQAGIGALMAVYGFWLWKKSKS